MAFSERVKILRKYSKLNQVDFALRLGIHPTTYANIEKGRNQSLTFDDIEKIMGHAEYGKYWLWLTTGETMPDAGQISPEIERQRSA